MRKICVVSSGRADYGLLYWPMKLIQQDAELELQVVVTGMHLSPEFGMTVNCFEKDGFPVSARVDMLLSGDSSIAVTKSMGLGVIGFADAIFNLQPDLLLLLGDRFEILAAAQAALIAQIPVAHMYGGDTTEGAFDEAIRHSITKMAHIHFVSNRVSWDRVRQMGENPANIHNVGATSLDAIHRAVYLNRNDFFRAIDFEARRHNLLITFHPVTLASISSAVQMKEMLDALDLLGSDYGLLFTKPNADPEGREMMFIMEEYVSTRAHAKLYDSLGELYLSALKHVDMVVGNSSSGIYEAPAFNIPTVNIGDRQRGRLQASSIINCAPVKSDIYQAINMATENRYVKVSNPYGDGASSERILKIIKAIDNPKSLLQKRFFMSCDGHNCDK